MSQILVRNLKATVVRGLKERAARKGRSLPSEVKSILERETGEKQLTMEEFRQACLEIQSHFKPGRAPDSVEIIREARERRGNPDRWK